LPIVTTRLPAKTKKGHRRDLVHSALVSARCRTSHSRQRPYGLNTDIAPPTVAEAYNRPPGTFQYHCARPRRTTPRPARPAVGPPVEGVPARRRRALEASKSRPACPPLHLRSPWRRPRRLAPASP